MGNLLQVINSGSLLWLTDILDGVWASIIGPIFWGLCDIFFIILDLFEMMFRKFAGIDTGVTNSANEAIEGDLVLYLINSNLVQQIFISVLVLSVLLLIIFTILAIVKNQYAEKQDPVSKIINSSFKALLMYLLVPVATIVCLIVGNIVLQAIDGATKATTNGGTASDMLFMAAAYNCNKLREEDGEGDTALQNNREELKYMIEKGYLSGPGIQPELNSMGMTAERALSATEEEIEYIAKLIDDAFTNGTISTENNIEKWRLMTVNRYYHTAQISLITVWVGGAFLIWAIGKITWGLVSRLFKMTLYYAISPAVMATFPIDGGKALGSWRGEMVKNGTSAYCAVGVLNILYSILPFFNDIELFGAAGGGHALSWLGNQVVKLFIYIIAFSSAKDLINTISGWFGTGNALADGVSAKQTVSGHLQKTGKNLSGAFNGLRGGAENAKKLGKSQFIGGLLGAYKGSGLSETTGFDPIKFNKEMKEQQKAGAEYYKDIYTTYGSHAKENENRFAAIEEIEKSSKAIDAEVSRLTAERDQEIRTARANGATTAEINEIRKRYMDEIEDLQRSASFIQPLFERREKQAKAEKEKLDKRSANFASLDSLAQAYERDKGYRARFDATLGRALTDSEWANIQSGNFDQNGFSDTEKNALQSVYTPIATLLENNAYQIQNSQKALDQLFRSGAKGRKYVTDNLGTVLGINANTNEIESLFNNQTAQIDSIIHQRDTEDKELQQAVADLEKSMKDIKDEKVNKYQTRKTFTSTEIDTIGRGLKK